MEVQTLAPTNSGAILSVQSHVATGLESHSIHRTGLELLTEEVYKGGCVPAHPSSQWSFPGMLSCMYGLFSDYWDKIPALTVLVTVRPCSIILERGGQFNSMAQT